MGGEGERAARSPAKTPLYNFFVRGDAYVNLLKPAPPPLEIWVARGSCEKCHFEGLLLTAC
jgi:hypothetical protein